MKKISLNRRNALLSPSGVSFGAVLLGVIVLLVLIRIALPGIFLSLVSPFVRGGSGLSSRVNAVESVFKNAATLDAENRSLKEQNVVLSEQNQILSAKVADLEALKLETAPVGGVVAPVLLRPPLSGYDTLVVRGGSDNHIAVDSRVFGAGGIPLGKVASVTSQFARVLLYSAPGQSSPGFIGSGRLAITLKGTGGGTFSASVSKEVHVAPGDAVYLASGGAIPIGTVLRVDEDSTSPSLVLRIQPAVNIFSVTWVSIVP